MVTWLALTVRTGSPISFSGTSGRGQGTANIGLPSLFTAAKHCALALLLLAGGHVVAAPWGAPKIVQEPVFGIKYDIEQAHFDLFPRALLARCSEYSDTTNWTVDQMWVYATARAGEATYYVIGGTLKRRNPQAFQSRYELDPLGGVISIEGSRCIGYGQAREVFNARNFDEIPRPVLQALADDLADRLVRGLGGERNFRRILKKNKIEEQSLSPELTGAFQRYISK